MTWGDFQGQVIKVNTAPTWHPHSGCFPKPHVVRKPGHQQWSSPGSDLGQEPATTTDVRVRELVGGYGLLAGPGDAMCNRDELWPVSCTHTTDL